MKKILFFAMVFLNVIADCDAQKELFVSLEGDDLADGTREHPFATWEKAMQVVKGIQSSQTINIFFRGGKYYFDKTLIFDSSNSGTQRAPIVYQAFPGEKVILSGAKKLSGLKWKYWKNGIYKTQLNEETNLDQLYVNGVRQIRARFPNYDYNDPLRSGRGYQRVVNGSNKRYDQWVQYDPLLFSNKKWADPTTGILHAFQSHNWGNMEYRIRAIDRKKNLILLGEGGWQLQREPGIGEANGQKSSFFIENILEELDTPGEWFLDKKQGVLYCYPPEGTKIQESMIEGVTVENLIELKGTPTSPVKYIQFKGFDITQTRTVFMERYEPLGRGDWAIHRSGAIFMTGTESCIIDDCNFEYVGGNAIFMSGYNKKSGVTSCRFYHTGESAVCFVGDTSAVKNYITWDDEDINNIKWNDKWKNKDMSPAPLSLDYPDECFMQNCIAYELGDYGKQVAGAFISMSRNITVSHCTIYDVPRAAVCINDGSWGGHVIENCDIWNTVRETGEHGPFNSWGRDRIWPLNDTTNPHLVSIDMLSPNILRHNRITNSRKTVSAGNWAIDLDDGSSNYEIYNNLCLGSTLKLREGYYRKVWNNIFVSAVPMGWHVWPSNSGDEFFNNISVITGTVPSESSPTRVFIKPISMPKGSKWGSKIDENLYYNINDSSSLMCPGIDIASWQQKGYDQHSVFSDPLFTDPRKEDYTVKPNSPALKMGFRNFPMNQFGHLMTRIQPFGGQFADSTQIVLSADIRGMDIRYTLDGTQPTQNSLAFSSPFYLDHSAMIRVQTFNGSAKVGFEANAVFTKVDTVKAPSWFKTLVDGPAKSLQNGEVKAERKITWKGAVLTDITRGDMVDAMGGFDAGVYMEDVPPLSEAFRLGFRVSDICIQWNGRKIKNIKEFNESVNAKNLGAIKVTVIRRYKKIVINF